MVIALFEVKTHVLASEAQRDFLNKNICMNQIVTKHRDEVDYNYMYEKTSSMSFSNKTIVMYISSYISRCYIGGVATFLLKTKKIIRFND